MYSRFVVWQSDTKVENQYESQDFNLFRLKEKALDIRFRLKGYGFKKIGESNRVIYHFGCYKCYYRKYGESEWTLFAHVQSERAGESSPSVYADVWVSTGVLEFGQYEFKIEACKLVELSNWSGGIIEGITEGDQFYYAICARQQMPNKVGAHDDALVEEWFNFGCDPIPLLATDTHQNYLDGLQCVDLATVILEHNIYGIWEELIAEDVLTIQYDYDMAFFEFFPVNEWQYVYLPLLHITPANYGESIKVTESRTLTFFPFYSFWYERIFVSEYAFGNIYGTCQNWDNISVSDVLFDISIFGSRTRWENISVSENISVNIFGTAQRYDYIYVTDVADVNIQGSRQVVEEIDVNENVSVLIPFTIQKSESITVSDVLAINIFGSTSLLFESIHITEVITANIPFYVLVFDSVHLAESMQFNAYGSILRYDSVYVSEDVDVHLPYAITVWDTPHVTESMVFNAYGSIVKQESIIFVTEYVAVLFPYSIVKFDSIAVSEFFKIELLSISKFDTVFTTEVFTPRLQSYVSKYEDIAVSEYASMALAMALPTRFDSISVVDNLTNIFIETGIGIVETVNVSEVVSISPSPNVSSADIINITEDVSFFLPLLNLTAIQNITVTEVLTPFLHLNTPMLLENIGHSEWSWVTLDRLNIPLQWENITVSEFFGTILGVEYISVSEVVYVTPSWVISYADYLTVSEYAFLQCLLYNIDVFESVTVTEFRKIECLSISVWDAPLVWAETVYVALQHNAVAFDNVHPTEYVSLGITYNVVAYDTVAITEATQFSGLQTANGVDYASVSESVSLTLYQHTLLINAVQYVFVSEFRKVECLSPVVVQYIYVTEYASVKVSHTAELVENIHITEVVSLSRYFHTLFISVFDFIPANEWIQVSQGVEVVDIINVADVATIEIAPDEAQVGDDTWVNGALTDNIQVQEYVAFYKYVVHLVTVYDGLSISENVAVSITVTVDEGDEVGVSGALYDRVYITEDVSIFQFTVVTQNTAYDTLTATDYALLVIGVSIDKPYDEAFVGGALFDIINVQEQFAYEVITYWFVSGYDEVAVVDWTTLYVPTEIYGAEEQVGVTGGLYDTITIAEFVQLTKV